MYNQGNIRERDLIYNVIINDTYKYNDLNG